MAVIKYKNPKTGKWERIDFNIKGIKGDKGDKGEDGADYILTDDDKSEIATRVNSANVWEKLYEITTDGTVKKWEITTYSNGTDMALTSLGVKIIANNPLAEAPSNTTITLSGKYIESGVEKLNVRVPIYNILSTTENLVAVATINNDRGIWLTKFCKAVANKSSQTSEEFYIPNNMFTYDGVEYLILNNIVITGAVPLTAGNTIEIWGIRA